MDARMEMDGLKALDEQLRFLDFKQQKTVLRKTSRESAKPVQQAMKQKINSLGHVDSGLLLESVKTRVTFPKNPRWADVVASVGIFKDNSMMRRFGLNPAKDMPPTVYGYWLEHGVQPHRTGLRSNVSSGRNIGTGLMHPGIPARPFIRPSFDARLNDVVGIIKTGTGPVHR